MINTVESTIDNNKLQVEIPVFRLVISNILN